MVKSSVLWLCLLLVITECGPGSSPRGVTIDFVGSVIENDSLAIEELLDLDSMVKRRMTEIPPTDSTQTHEYFRNKILQNLLDEGGIRENWMNHRCVVNNENIRGDTAEVELTLMDQESGRIHYLTVYLYRSPSGWRVFYFL